NANRVFRVLEEYPELKGKLNEPLVGHGLPALLAAGQRTDRNTIDVLLRAAADLNTRSQWWAIAQGALDECAPELAEFLIERGATLDAHSAARLGMLEKVQEFVSADPAVVSARGYAGQTPLHFSSTIEVAKYLLDHGAEIDARDLE